LLLESAKEKTSEVTKISEVYLQIYLFPNHILASKLSFKDSCDMFLSFGHGMNFIFY